MEIGKISAVGSASGGQAAGIRLIDTVSRNIENEIFGIQRKMQELTSNEEIPAEEKMRKRQELQQEMSRLNAELRRHQAEVSREQRKEAMASEEKEAQGQDSVSDTGSAQERSSAAGVQEEKDAKSAGQTDGSADAKSIDKGIEDVGAELTLSGIGAMLAADSSVQQAKSQGVVVGKIESGIAILKGEIRQDKLYGTNVERKEEILAKQRKKVSRALGAQFSALGNAKQTMKENVKAKADKAVGNANTVARTQSDDGDKVLLKAVVTN